MQLLRATLIFALYVSNISAQDTQKRQVDSIITHLPGRYLTAATQKANRMQRSISTYNEKALRHLMQQEAKMKSRLAKVDPAAAAAIFDSSMSRAMSLSTTIREKASKLAPLPSSKYTGYLDTLQNTLLFLKSKQSPFGASGALKDKIAGSLEGVQELGARFEQAEQIKAYIRDRRAQLQQQLATHAGFTKDLEKYNKTAYYYGERVKEYKALVKDRKRAEKKAMQVLNQLPAYKNFLRKHSILAGLFNAPSSDKISERLAGLQTRSQVEQLLSTRIGGSGPDARAALSQQMSQSREQFSDLKAKFPDLDNAADMPNFKPSELKGKTFLQRLEFGGNVQFARSTRFYPTTGDFAGQVGYKFHKNGQAGIGAAYKLGMGSGFDNIHFSNQGVGLRSFIDWTLKGTFYLNAGYEQNYIAGLQDAQQLRSGDSWQSSALLGISKKYRIASKLKGNIILLYDFLYNRHFPQTSPLKLRLGYSF